MYRIIMVERGLGPMRAADIKIVLPLKYNENPKQSDTQEDTKHPRKKPLEMWYFMVHAIFAACLLMLERGVLSIS